MKRITLLALLFLVTPKLFFSQTCSTCPNQTDYGNGNWIGYVYDHNGSGNPVTNPFATYKGCVTEPANFNRNWGTGNPSCAAGGNNFGVRYRMRMNFAPGTYSFTIGGDDGVRLSFDGGTTWEMTDWVDHSYRTTTATKCLSGTSDLVLEYYEKGGDARVSFSYTQVSTDFIMPQLTSRVSTCGGMFYDSGGATGDYSNGEDRIITFFPTNSCDKVRLTFSAFSTENNYDGMQLFDGNSIAAPLISSGLAAGSNATTCPAGSWRGSVSPGTVTSTAADGSLTIRFRSDGSVVSSGWAAAVSCISAPNGIYPKYLRK
jgi:hypothetical protein